MVKSVKDLPFSIAQKISEEDSIVWLKESNKYIILNSAILALIKKKSAFSPFSLSEKNLKFANPPYHPWPKQMDCPSALARYSLLDGF